MRRNNKKIQKIKFNRSNFQNTSHKLISSTIKINRTLSLGQKNRIDTNRTKFQDLINHRKRISLIVFFIIGIIFFLTLSITQLTGNSGLFINTISMKKNPILSEYEASFKEFLDSNPLYRVRFLLDQKSLDDYMSINKPEVLSITDIGKQSFFKTGYKINFRKPVAKWQIYDTVYYVDSYGKAFENNYFEEPDLNIIDNSGIRLEKGEAIVSNKFLKFVGRLVEEALNKGYFITEAIIPPEKTREVDIKLKGRGTIIKLAVDREVTGQIEDMNRVLLYMDKTAIQPSYIDIRISGKAFYK